MMPKRYFDKVVIHRANARLMACEDISRYVFDKRYEPKTHDELRAAFMKAARIVSGKNV